MNERVQNKHILEMKRLMGLEWFGLVGVGWGRDGGGGG